MKLNLLIILYIVSLSLSAFEIQHTRDVIVDLADVHDSKIKAIDTLVLKKGAIDKGLHSYDDFLENSLSFSDVDLIEFCDKKDCIRVDMRKRNSLFFATSKDSNECTLKERTSHCVPGFVLSTKIYIRIYSSKSVKELDSFNFELLPNIGTSYILLTEKKLQGLNDLRKNNVIVDFSIIHNKENDYYITKIQN